MSPRIMPAALGLILCILSTSALAKGIEVKTHSWFPSVVIMMDDGSLLKTNKKKTRVNTEKIAETYYRHYPDNKHFLLIFSQGKSVLES